MLRIFRQYYPIRNIFFVIVEGLAIYMSVMLAARILLGVNDFFFHNWLFTKGFLITFVYLICLYYNDLYDISVASNLSELSIRLLQALGAASIFLAGVYFFFPETIIGKGVFGVSIVFVILFVISWRLAYSLILKYDIFNENIIMLGSGELAQNIMTEISNKRDCGYTVTVVVSDCSASVDSLAKRNGTILKKGNDGLCEMAKQMNIKKIIVALKEKRGVFPAKELLRCRVDGIEILEGNTFYEMLTGRLAVKNINPAWLIFSEGFRKSWFQNMLKRVADLLLSCIMLVLFLPVIIATAVLIKLDSKGPVIFSQERVGRHKQLFKVHKFRSMIANAEKKTGPVWAQDNDDRITRVGRIIRKLRIDEVPQLWNVLKGEMSFVGPRPEREFFVNQLEDIIPYYGERFRMKPGVTGWAQVCYSYGASVEDAEEKLNYDLFYIKNMSILMDVMIIFRTIKTVLFGKGAR